MGPFGRPLDGHYLFDDLDGGQVEWWNNCHGICMDHKLMDFSVASSVTVPQA